MTRSRWLESCSWHLADYKSLLDEMLESINYRFPGRLLNDRPYDHSLFWPINKNQSMWLVGNTIRCADTDEMSKQMVGYELTTFPISRGCAKIIIIIIIIVIYRFLIQYSFMLKFWVNYKNYINIIENTLQEKENYFKKKFFYMA